MSVHEAAQVVWVWTSVGREHKGRSGGREEGLPASSDLDTSCGYVPGLFPVCPQPPAGMNLAKGAGAWKVVGLAVGWSVLKRKACEPTQLLMYSNSTSDKRGTLLINTQRLGVMC